MAAYIVELGHKQRSPASILPYLLSCYYSQVVPLSTRVPLVNANDNTPPIG